MHVGNLACVLAYVSGLPMGDTATLHLSGCIYLLTSHGNIVFNFNADFWPRPVGQRVSNMVLV